MRRAVHGGARYGGRRTAGVLGEWGFAPAGRIGEDLVGRGLGGPGDLMEWPVFWMQEDKVHARTPEGQA
jgi:hypothetical protein